MGLAVVAYLFEISLKGGNIVLYTGNLFSYIKILDSQSTKSQVLLIVSTFFCPDLFLQREESKSICSWYKSASSAAGLGEIAALCLPSGSNPPYFLNTCRIIPSVPESSIYFNLLAVLKISLTYEYFREL